MNQPAATTTVVEIQHSSDRSRTLDVGWIQSQILAAIGFIRSPIERVEVRIVVDAEMAALHDRFCGLPTTTDVLTFPQSEPGQPVTVDIAVCIDEASRRAAEFGHPLERELLLYVLHGLLHCVGFDDRSEAEHAAMHAEEDRILTAIGIGPVFHTPTNNGDSTHGAATG